MSEKEISPSIMIISGESSGELYGALLAKEIRGKWPHVRIFGVGGERMREAGVEVFSDIASALGALEVVSSLKKIKRTFDKTIAVMREVRPAIIVLIDYPDFNLRVAKEALKSGIKILYYVSPQVWAWRKGRVKSIARLVDKMAVLLPFEKRIYENAGLPCEFVGHPILEEIGDASPSKGDVSKESSRRKLGISEDARLIALLPGSRHNELNRHLPVIAEFVEKFKAEFPESGFVLPLAPNLDRARYEGRLRSLDALSVRIIEGNAVAALAASDAAVVASGTASFQAALIGTPTTVIYKLSTISYLIGRLIIDVPYISLVNLILGRQVIREFIQSEANAENIMAEVKRLINDTPYRDAIVESFREVRAMYEGLRPSKRVAEIAGEMAGLR